MTGGPLERVRDELNKLLLSQHPRKGR
ncbi:hypothetical protein, partial [Streptomyces sp. NPDC026589]